MKRLLLRFMLVFLAVLTISYAAAPFDSSDGGHEKTERSRTRNLTSPKIQSLHTEGLARYIGVSNSYFSSMFKKETGNSFVGYLTEYRMDKAARMLVETAEKSYMIAKSVGYSDPNYFSYVFKRQFGVSPSKYRTAYEKNEK